MREREDANRTREAGHLDEIQGVAANMLRLQRNGAVGFIVWLGGKRRNLTDSMKSLFPMHRAAASRHREALRPECPHRIAA